MAPHARPPAVAGQFYAGTGAELAHQVEACFRSERGPGELPARHRTPDRRIRAAIVPHAGYEFSGPIAALAYSQIAGERPPESVLILGVDHHGAGEGPAVSDVPWLTPLGPTPIDEGLRGALTRPPVRVDEPAHALEHSIEVQLPFLEYVLPHPRFVPLQIPFDSLAALERVGRVVANAVRGRDTLLIASTDFSHYVPAEVADRLDHLAIDAILSRDPGRLYETVAKNDISMCGIAPTTVLLAALSSEPLTARLLRWGHSGEAARMRDVVGYASLLFESGSPVPPPVK
ncbi:MAG: AmmeMemoRadiSam system protein B [Thermoplasmata archaeon]|jgi:MEMO1 family protein